MFISMAFYDLTPSFKNLTLSTSTGGTNIKIFSKRNSEKIDHFIVKFLFLLFVGHN